MESLDGYLSALASEWPTPGGGSAAILVAACGAALVAMVARICGANAKYAEYHDLSRTTIAKADALREELLARRARDEEAFDRVVCATALPRTTDEQKQSRALALERALGEAAAQPLAASGLALRVLQLAGDLLAIPNRNLASDVGCAAEFARAAVAACAYNVRINHRFMKDAPTISAQAETIARYEREASSRAADVRRAVESALGAGRRSGP